MDIPWALIGLLAVFVGTLIRNALRDRKKKRTPYVPDELERRRRKKQERESFEELFFEEDGTRPDHYR